MSGHGPGFVEIDQRGRHRRRTMAVLVFGGTALASLVLAGALAPDGITPLDLAVVLVFALTFAWISGAFWTAVAGVVAELGDDMGPRSPSTTLDPTTQTALLVPVYHEDVDQVARHITAVERSLARTGRRGWFDWYILSDSRSPEVVRAERAMWGRLCTELGGSGRIFYRRRVDNVGRKAGNIAEWCRRWGIHYRYFLVLDADSVMSGPTLVDLVRWMDANPDAGLMQTVPQPVGGITPLARLVQFASALHGHLLAKGIAHLFPGRGNYWGHNAIIRTRAFMTSAGLPTLPGRPPLGGEILSHDFVEAALLRRAGWAVWMLPELGGSWEGLPPTLRDHVRRDRRWCQGNLQHLRVLLAKGLCPVSRMHLASGAMAYLSSPLWLMLIALGALAGLTGHGGAPVPALGADVNPWPLFGLVAWTATMLLAPRIMAGALVVADRRRREEFGGAGQLLRSLLLEFGASVLLAPLQAFHHTRAVIGTFVGHAVGWGAQDRQGSGESWRDAFALHGVATVSAAVVTGALAIAAPMLLLWFAPVLLGLLLAVPMAVWVSSAAAGQRLARHGWLTIPEESDHPAELVAAGLDRSVDAAGAPATAAEAPLPWSTAAPTTGGD